MKLHWGYRIAILYCGFVAFMLFLVVKSSSEDFSLVSQDYYEKEIQYQQQIDKMQNAAALKEKMEIQWMQGENKVRVAFPRDLLQVSGQISLYRPADPKKDFKVPIGLNPDNFQDVAFAAKEKGLWRVQVDWKSADKEYFAEKPLVIP